jgi:hypothetical protein
MFGDLLELDLKLDYRTFAPVDEQQKPTDEFEAFHILFVGFDNNCLRDPHADI